MCGPHCTTRHVWPGSRRGKYPLARIKPLYYHCTAGSRARPCGLWPSLPCSWPPLPCLWPSLPRCEQDNIKVFLAAVCCLCLYFISKVDNQFYSHRPKILVPRWPVVTKQLTLSGVPTFTRSAVFLNIVQKAFDPPPLRFEHHVANCFDGFLKKRVNVCRDKIRQNNA